MDTILNRKSGKLGVSGVSFDDRDIEAAAKEGNERAKLAIDTFVSQAIGYIGRYAAQMNGVDVITFAGGVGENGPEVRSKICKSLEFLGVKIDEEKNNVRGKECEISTPDSAGSGGADPDSQPGMRPEPAAHQDRRRYHRAERIADARDGSGKIIGREALCRRKQQEADAGQHSCQRAAGAVAEPPVIPANGKRAEQIRCRADCRDERGLRVGKAILGQDVRLCG